MVDASGTNSFIKHWRENGKNQQKTLGWFLLFIADSRYHPKTHQFDCRFFHPPPFQSPPPELFLILQSIQNGKARQIFFSPSPRKSSSTDSRIFFTSKIGVVAVGKPVGFVTTCKNLRAGWRPSNCKSAGHHQRQWFLRAWKAD